MRLSPLLEHGASGAKVIGLIQVWAIPIRVGFNDLLGPTNTEYPVITALNLCFLEAG